MSRMQRLSRLPDSFRNAAPNSWAKVRRNGAACDSFLEGACVDAAGAFWCVDIANGRILKLKMPDDWSVVHEYGGWPTGMKLRLDGSLLIADNRLGLLQLEPGTGGMTVLVDSFEGNPLHGPNDLVLSLSGDVYFTDQGESDLTRPYGRVFRYRADGRLELIASGLPSPNGLALAPGENMLYVAMTQANAIWRVMLRPDGSVGKTGHAIQLSGSLGGGPDGIAFDAAGNLYVCHALAGCVRVFDRFGEPIERIDTAEGPIPTNLALGGPGDNTLYVTEAETGTVQVHQLGSLTAGRAP